MSSTADKFTISCPQCGEVVLVSRAHVGKKGRCKMCQSIFPIVEPVDDLVEIPSPASAGAGGAAWDDDEIKLAPTPQAPVAQTRAPSMSDDYLLRAREYKGPTIQQEESDANYRFATSYGSIIGGIATIVSGVLLALFLILCFLSPYLLVLAVMIIAAGIGWVVMGMNYVTYYNWKRREGR